MDIDIIIPTAKRIEESNYSICFAIRSILAQTIQPQNIIVTLNEDNDTTIKIIKDMFGDFIRVIEYDASIHNISYARNLGVKASDAKIIVFMDDDVVLGNNDVLKTISIRLEKEDFYCGAHRFWTPTHWSRYFSLNDSINHIQRILQFCSFKPSSINRDSGKRGYNDFSFIGNLGAIKREVFNKIGGFDEKFEGWTYQDTDLMMRLCVERYSYLLMSDDGISAYHLSHPADKSKYRNINKELYHKKQEILNISFHLNHFFGIFEPLEDTYELVTPINQVIL